MNHLSHSSGTETHDSGVPVIRRFLACDYGVITGHNYPIYNGPDVNQSEYKMQQLSAAALLALEEIWESIHLECTARADRAYQASLWRMAGNICTGYALQHRDIDTEASDAFAWLASICDEHQLLALSPAALKQDKLKLAVVQSLPRVH